MQASAKNRLKPLLYFTISTAITLLVLEAALWVRPLPDPYEIVPEKRFHRFLANWNAWTWSSPYRKEPPFTATFSAGPLNGVEERPVDFEINKYGYIYPVEHHERSSQTEIRIAAVGGSTVECIALQPDRRWPEVLGAKLRQAFPNRPVTILNLGQSNQAAPTHLATVAQHAVKLDLDAIVVMLGANDLRRAAVGWKPILDAERFYTVRHPDAFRYLTSRTQLGRRTKLLIARVTSPSGKQTLKKSAFKGRAYFSRGVAARQRADVLPFAPEISDVALEDYASDILSLAGLANGHNIRILFTTQPMLWKADATPEEDAVDWLGIYDYKSERYRLESGVSASLLETLNSRLIDTCAPQGIAHLDLAEIIPRSFEAFYDCVHFNENGARLVGESVADAMLSHRFFAEN